MSFKQFSMNHLNMINKELAFFLDNQIQDLKTNEPFIKEGYSLIRDYTVLGGKRLRPLAMILSYLSSGGKKEKSMFLPAIAIELHHTYSLILDDIMDEDELRRNKPTVYKRLKDYFLKNFSEQKYEGSLFTKKSSRFSVSYAIMLGNLTNILSKQAIFRSDFSDEAKIKALQIIESEDEKIYHGQMMDVLMEYKKKVSEKEYLEMIKLKTAVLFAASFELGALFAGADENTQYLLKEFGMNSALAFQLQDDIIDIMGDKGHEKGSDIKKGKKTLLIIKAYEKADASQKKILDTVFGSQNANEDAINKVIRIIQDTGAIDYCRKLSDNYVKAAKKNIGALNLDSYYKEVFSGFSESMVKRNN